MSGPGSPELTVTGAANLRVGVVAGRWHARFADALLAGARRALAEHGIEEPTVVTVPGSFELPVVAKRLAGIGYDAVVALGVVIRGETPHFDYVCQAVAVGLSHVAVDTGVPVGFGVLTCDTPEQAADRCGLPGSREDKGYDTAMAAIATALAVRRTQEWR